MSDINYGDGWTLDKLQRKSEAEYLTTYLIGKSKQEHNSFNSGSFVLNVNSEWGFGKTYFIRNWADDLGAMGHPVVYFDAWQNDFSKDPLIAFISTINSQLEPYFNEKIGEKRGLRVQRMLSAWYENGKKLLNPSAPFLWGILAKKLAGLSLEQLGELFDDENDDVHVNTDSLESDVENDEVKHLVSTVVSKAASQMLANHNSTKKTINEFKISLEKLTRHLDSLKKINIPIFIFVDELDRCRPDYAIELLEKIKHLFGVQGVFFIVATASEQLCHSINKVYGQNFDSTNYLKRFFDQAYILHEPDRHNFAKYLFQQYNLTNRENLFSPLDKGLFKDDNINVLAFSFMATALDVSLRDMVQYCILIDSISIVVKSAPIHIMYVLFLARTKDVNPDLYKRIVSNDRITSSDISTSSSMRKELNTCVLDRYTFSARSEITASSLMLNYIKFSNTNLMEIRKEWQNKKHANSVLYSIVDTLLQEIPHSYETSRKPTPHLSIYPKLIEQAGRIT